MSHDHDHDNELDPFAARVRALESVYHDYPEAPRELAVACSDLAVYEVRYGDAHPKLISQRSKVAALLRGERVAP